MEKILIIDFGSQYTHLIARRIRGLGVYSEISEPGISLEKIKEYKGLILSGGPESVYVEGSPSVDKGVFELNIPILGICYGHQLMSHLLGGEVVKGDGIGAEFGKAEMEVLKSEGILSNFEKGEKTCVWMSHADKVSRLPEGFEILATSKDDPYSVVADLKRNFFGIQFHPEVVHTEKGNGIYSNFVDLCKVSRDWKPEDHLNQVVDDIKKQVADRKVFMLISGGVDSSVAYSLIVKAIGQERVKGFLIDTGFLRKNEGAEVVEMLNKAGINIEIEDAKDEFLKDLEGISEPEEKRKKIGQMFLTIQKKIVERMKLDPEHWMLGQGTIYPDTIESGATKHSHKIKTHHNRVKEIQEMMEKGLVIEPLKELYKDEVRKVGLALGLPEDLIWRRPFPGPGLAVRILCNNNAILHEHEHFESLELQINAFLLQQNINLKAVVLPIKSVGVQGDFRTYKHPVALYGNVENWDILRDLAPAITNKFHDVNRVIYLFNNENIDKEKVLLHEGYLTNERINLLQEIDDISMKWLDNVDMSRQVWQMPVVLIPLSISDDQKNSIVLRPVISEEAMTANFAELPISEVKNLATEILKNPGISAVFYDITNKPPGTIEWE